MKYLKPYCCDLAERIKNAIRRLDNNQMSGLDGLGHPEPMTAGGAANTLKYIADDHPCCAHALGEIVAWLESSDAETTSDAQAWKELYNLASFDWDTMPEAGKRKFRELVFQSASQALDRRLPAPSKPD